MHRRKTKKIIIFSGKGDFSGVPAYIKKIKRLGIIDDFEAVVIIGTDYGGYDEIKDHRTTIHSFKGFERGAPLSLVRAIQYVSKSNVDVVLANGFIGILVARVLYLLKRRKLKLYVIHHGLPFDVGATSVQRMIGLFCEKFFLYLNIKQTIISISLDNSVELKQLFKKSRVVDVIYIPNSINIDGRKGNPNKRSKLTDCHRGVWIGRDSNQKNPELLTKIANKLPDNYTIDVYGKFTSKRVSQLEGLSSNKLNFKGYGPLDLDYVFKDADFFIQTSKYEGFSIAMLEAAKYHLPIFSTMVSGVSDLQLSYSGVKVFSNCDDAASKLLQHDFHKRYGWLDNALSDDVWAQNFRKLMRC